MIIKQAWNSNPVSGKEPNSLLLKSTSYTLHCKSIKTKLKLGFCNADPSCPFRHDFYIRMLPPCFHVISNYISNHTCFSTKNEQGLHIDRRWLMSLMYFLDGYCVSLIKCDTTFSPLFIIVKYQFKAKAHHHTSLTSRVNYTGSLSTSFQLNQSCYGLYSHNLLGTRRNTHTPYHTMNYCAFLNSFLFILSFPFVNTFFVFYL